MSTDLFKQVLFNDGEGLTHTDLNAMQDYLKSILMDGILATNTPNVGGGRDPEFGAQGVNGASMPWTNVALARAYTLTPGTAYLRQGSSNGKIQISAGMLFQLPSGSITGDTPNMLGFKFAGTEEFTLTNGDVTNPRVDLLQMKLEVVNDATVDRDFEDGTTHIVTSTLMSVTRRIQCTLSVKAGTPFAAFPIIPEPDAGYCVVGSVIVGHGWTTAGNAPIFGKDTVDTNNLVVHDQRMPFRVRAYWVDPSQFKLVLNWAFSDSWASVTSSNATNDMYISCPAGLGRLVGVGIQALTHAFGAELGQASGISVDTYLARNFISSSTTGFVVTSYTDFEANQSNDAGPDPVQSATTKIGEPLWTNGRRSPHEATFLTAPGSVPGDRLVMHIHNAPNGTSVGNIVFYVAEGF